MTIHNIPDKDFALDPVGSAGPLTGHRSRCSLSAEIRIPSLPRAATVSYMATVLRCGLLISLAAIILMFNSDPVPGAEKPVVHAAPRRPNILIAVSDDQSFAHTSFAGYRAVQTPAFDRIAREGVCFSNAYAASPGCSPSRASLLTGRHPWQNEQAGTHASTFPKKYLVFPALLEQSGYFVGMTGKGWGPGDFRSEGWAHNPAGREYQKRTAKAPVSGISNNDYAANFADFLASKGAEQPFCFWYGAHEPHRVYDKGAGLRAGKRLEDAVPPAFLPDTAEIRSDILDYCLEIEWFDLHLARMLTLLEQEGELENTLVIVTSDNGMPFPRAKANLYDYGFHVPLAIRWGNRIPAGRVVEDIVGFVDLTATILEAACTGYPSESPQPAGRSLLPLLISTHFGLTEPDSAVAFGSRERHSSSRINNLTYPQRAVRMSHFLYVRNFRPQRWPAGDPIVLRNDGTPGDPHSGYKDIDACPSLDFLIANADVPGIREFLQLAVERRPEEELFDLRTDPGCLTNLAFDTEYADTRSRLSMKLEDVLRETGDPRMIDGGDVWETYPRTAGELRRFPPPE